MEAFVQDLQYGWRMICRRPAVTTVALISLVVGITLPAVVFSLLNAVVFKPLPVANPNELAIVHEVRTTGINHNLPYPDFVDYRNAQHSFTDLAAYAGRDITVRVGGESRVLAGELVSGNFVSLLGVSLRAGRAISDADDRPSSESVAVVSEGLWREMTGRDVADGFSPQIVIVNAQEFAIVGVAAAPFRGMQLGRDARIWLPIHAQPLLEGPGSPNYVTRRTASWLTLIGRLRPGVTREAAAVDLNHIELALAPAVGRPQPKLLTMAAGRQGDSSLPRAASSGLMMLLGAGVLVLLVAAANVASLLLVRASERVREMAVRAALGALRALTPDAFSEGGRTASEGRAASRVRGTLVVTQFALSLSLVVACLLSARTVYNLRTLPTGFDIDRIALVGVDPEAAQYDLTRSRSYMAAAAERVAALPGVRAVGVARVLPLGFGGSRTTVIVPGYQPSPDEDMELNFNTATPSYFEAMGIRLLDGRFFGDRDTRERPRVVVVNETMASRYWPRGNAVGQRIRFAQDGPDIEVVGIAQDVKYRMLREDARPSFYIPYAQSGARGGTLHVRTWDDPGAVVTTVRQALTGVDANVPITMVRTLRDQAALNVTDERLAMFIALTLAGAALLLAAVGLYGSMSYAVGRRTRELGVRLALGATVADIWRLILGQGLKLCILGTALGSGVALAFGRSIEHRLFGVTGRDPLTLVLSAAILSVVAIIACWIPARRAMKVDPAHALRV